MGSSASARLVADAGRELAALERIEACTVERVLKQGPPETTELVREPNGGPGAGALRIRKTFEGEGGLGSAYELLADAQATGAACERLPRVRACARVGETRFVLLDYVEGETLQDLVEAGPLPARRALDVAIEVCRAAEELHALPAGPLIHRDIKPSNVIVNSDRVTLIDLGIARAWRPGAERDTVRFGTPGFAPPEQYGYGQTSVESDVYAIGMVLAFCLAGKVPDQDERTGGFPSLPEGLRAFVARATSFDPADRYPTVADFRRDLEGARDRWAGCGPEKPPTSFPRKRPARSEGRGRGDRWREAAARLREAAARPGSRGRGDRWRKVASSPAFRRVGWVWDAVLLVWFAFSFAVAVGIVVWPTSSADRSLPLAVRALEYLGIMGPVQALVLLPFVYTGGRRSSFHLVGRVSWLRGLLRCWGLALACVLAIFVFVGLLAPTAVAAG